jgi:hypothetical protein
MTASALVEYGSVGDAVTANNALQGQVIGGSELKVAFEASAGAPPAAAAAAVRPAASSQQAALGAAHSLVGWPLHARSLSRPLLRHARASRHVCALARRAHAQRAVDGAAGCSTRRIHHLHPSTSILHPHHLLHRLLTIHAIVHQRCGCCCARARRRRALLHRGRLPATSTIVVPHPTCAAAGAIARLCALHAGVSARSRSSPAAVCRRSIAPPPRCHLHHPPQRPSHQLCAWLRQPPPHPPPPPFFFVCAPGLRAPNASAVGRSAGWHQHHGPGAVRRVCAVRRPGPRESVPRPQLRVRPVPLHRRCCACEERHAGARARCSCGSQAWAALRRARRSA